MLQHVTVPSTHPWGGSTPHKSSPRISGGAIAAQNYPVEFFLTAHTNK